MISKRCVISLISILKCLSNTTTLNSFRNINQVKWLPLVAKFLQAPRTFDVSIYEIIHIFELRS